MERQSSASAPAAAAAPVAPVAAAAAAGAGAGAAVEGGFNIKNNKQHMTWIKRDRKRERERERGKSWRHKRSQKVIEWMICMGRRGRLPWRLYLASSSSYIRATINSLIASRCLIWQHRKRYYSLAAHFIQSGPSFPLPFPLPCPLLPPSISLILTPGP